MIVDILIDLKKNVLIKCRFYLLFENAEFMWYYNDILINNKRNGVVNILSIQKKIEMACTVAGISKTELGRRIGLSQSAFLQRLKTGKFSDEDFEKMANALGAEYFSGFKFKNGVKIE